MNRRWWQSDGGAGRVNRRHVGLRIVGVVAGVGTRRVRGSGG